MPRGPILPTATEVTTIHKIQRNAGFGKKNKKKRKWISV
jgi:hypothetical protein